jgi:hypothetical protein
MRMQMQMGAMEQNAAERTNRMLEEIIGEGFWGLRASALWNGPEEP